jgi:hypothetical protein
MGTNLYQVILVSGLKIKYPLEEIIFLCFLEVIFNKDKTWKEEQNRTILMFT